MKHLIWFTCLALILFAFRRGDEKPFVPPGTVRVNDTLFCDEAEISNGDWKEFENYNLRLFGKSSVQYISSLPDTSVWKRIEKIAGYDLGPAYYFRDYYRNPLNKDYPVVGVSFEQAWYYCQWRTDREHIKMEIKAGKRKAEDIDKPYKGKIRFIYRLPAKQEWEALALTGIDLSKLKSDEKAMKKYRVLYAGDPDTAEVMAGNATATVLSYWGNRLGIYNMIGNVSEMISEKGIAKGGNWNTKYDSLNVLRNEEYASPAATIGFRCVCVLRK
jgi:formylglycine-generating enzyme required for sulfatase activity